MRRFAAFPIVATVFLGGCAVVYNYDDFTDGAGGAGGDTTNAASTSSVSGSGGGGNGGGGNGGGQVLAPEVCNNQVDDNGDTIDCTLSPTWADRFGNEFHQAVKVIRPAPGNGAIIAGDFNGSFIPGKGTAATLTAPDEKLYPYVARLDSNGNVIQARSLDLSGAATAASVVFDDVFIAGHFFAPADPTQKSLFVKRFTPTMVATDEWELKLLEIGKTNSMTAMVPGNVPMSGPPMLYVAGHIGVNTTFPDCDIVGDHAVSANDIDSFILRLDPTTKACLSRIMITKGYIKAMAMSKSSIDSGGVNDRLVVAGYYDNKVDLPNAPPSMGKTAFITMFDVNAPSVKSVAYLRPASVGYISFASVNVDPLNADVYGVGTVSGTSVDLGTTDGVDAFVVAYKSDASLNWIRSIGGAGTQVATGVVHHDGKVYVSGLTDSKMKIANGEVVSGDLCLSTVTGGKCAFLARLSASDGNAEWVTIFGSNETTADATALLSKSTTDLWFASAWSAPIDLGSGSLSPMGTTTNQDIVLGTFGLVSLGN